MRIIAATLLLATAPVLAGDEVPTWKAAEKVRVESAIISGVVALDEGLDRSEVIFSSFGDAVPAGDRSVAFLANGLPRDLASIGAFGGAYRVDADGHSSTLVETGDVLEDEYRRVAAVKSLEVDEGNLFAWCLLDDGEEERVFLSNDSGPDGEDATRSRAGHWLPQENPAVYQTLADGTLRIVADKSTRVAELFDGPFTGFGPRTIETGPWVIFTGYASSYVGLFAMNTQTNALFVLLDNRTPLDSRRIGDLRLSSSPLSGADLAMAVSFADGISGVYIFQFSDSRGNLLFRGHG